MNDTNISASKIAEFLLKIKAIILRPQNPFTWASGMKSPIYCDNRLILSFPNIRKNICQQFVALAQKRFPKPDIIAGVATGGIAQGMLIAESMNLPFIYIRPKSKSHGRQNQIEGVVKKEDKILVIEDLISTGVSGLKAVQALKEVKCDVVGLLAIFTYQFSIAEENFKKNNCNYDTLCNYDILIETAKKINAISNSDLISLKKWRKNPNNWS